LPNTLLISDLHLEPERPDITATFFEFLQSTARQAEALFILGDLFEVWIGDDYSYPLGDEVARQLSDLSRRGVAIYLMHGNRDFLIGQDYSQRCNAQLIEEPYVTELGGEKTVLLHGDVLCTQDTEYMQFRSLVRTPQWQQNFLAQSIEQRLQIAQQARQQSHQATANKGMEIMDVTTAEVQLLLGRLQVSTMIHGHTHRPANHWVPSSDGGTDRRAARRIVLGDWDKHLWYIEATTTDIRLEKSALAKPGL